VAGDTFDFRHLDRRKIVRRASVMAEEIVPARNEEMANFHRAHDNIRSNGMKEDGIAADRIIRCSREGAEEYVHDELTIEEPLEIRVGGRTVATTMRTPGHDEELAAGFLISEALLRPNDKIDNFFRPETARNRDNIIEVNFDGAANVRLNAAQRFGTISSSCGICGRESIDALRQTFPPLRSTSCRIDIGTLLALPAKLQDRQRDFARTGGIHAAGIFDSRGDVVAVREDIGRHNAVDKAVGRAFLEGMLPLDRHVLVVSGRASFEIMQKALAAGVPIVASVSAPSALAVEFARVSNQTLIAFLRPPNFNVYAHAERLIMP
jgi:FdhD protein